MSEKERERSSEGALDRYVLTEDLKDWDEETSNSKGLLVPGKWVLV